VDSGHHPSVLVIFHRVFRRRTDGNATLATLTGGHGVPAACLAATLTGKLDLCLALIAGLIFAIISLIIWLARC
jgi:hypothetical protein